jgi:hypothetical protein
MTDDALVALARDIVRLLACLEDTATFPANSPERSRVVRTLAACECSLEDACTPDVILSLVERVQRAEKALAVATTPDIIGVGDETAYAEDDFSGLFDGLNFDEIVEVWANKQLGERWAARIITKWDENGDVEEDEVRLFASLRLAEEAQAAAEATRPKASA